MSTTILQRIAKGVRSREGQGKRWKDHMKEWKGLWIGDSLRATEDRKSG